MLVDISVWTAVVFAVLSASFHPQGKPSTCQGRFWLTYPGTSVERSWQALEWGVVIAGKKSLIWNFRKAVKEFVQSDLNAMLNTRNQTLEWLPWWAEQALCRGHPRPRALSQRLKQEWKQKTSSSSRFQSTALLARNFPLAVFYAIIYILLSCLLSQMKPELLKVIHIRASQKAPDEYRINKDMDWL